MRDVARVAGVSLKTVSRVINEEAGVAPSTGARVGDAIATLGFERNDLARSLRQGRSSLTLGLIIEDLANPFYSAIANAVEACARALGYLLITASAGEDPVLERELVGALLRRRVDALLVVPAGSDHRHVASRTPTVFLDRLPHALEADTVLFDNVGGARAGVAHLIAQGHTRIACVLDDPGVYTHELRRAGYRQALAEAGIAEDLALVRTGNHDVARARATVQDLLALPAGRRPTAVFATNNRMTVGALHALAAEPRRPALVGFDDFELADLLGTTVVRADPWRLGEEAAALAFARVAGDEAPPRTVTVATELVRRGSGEVPA